MQAGVQQGSVLSPTLFNIYTNDAPQTHGVHLVLFADDICLYATDCKEGFIARKGGAIAQAVSRWLPIAVARVYVISGHVGFVEDKVALGQVFS
jgi:hypothetical protein